MILFTQKRRTFALATVLVALFAAMPVLAVKYVAVVETDVDAQSGASAAINPAEVRLITAELRRQAAENLPSEKYSVMTSETVMSMGGAVLEECSEENCVILLGSKIGADYIVRGTISKFQTKFTLTVEMYETENGTLVATSEPVRSEKPAELLEMATGSCADMYRKFAGMKVSARKPKTSENKHDTDGGRDGDESIALDERGRGYYFASKYQVPVGTPSSWGGINLEGGWTWKNGVFWGFDISGSGERTGDSTGNLFAGIGTNLGYMYDFGGQLQLGFGGSVGFWVEVDNPYKYKNDDEAQYTKLNFFGPFVKLRWKYIELMYRGLLGNKQVFYDKASTNGGKPTEEIDEHFGWHSHQLMAGFYFSRQRSAGRIFDYYFAPKYQNTLWKSYGGLNIESGLVWGNGMFCGIEFDVDGGDHRTIGGGGFSLGNVYELNDALQLVYGGSVGFWAGVDRGNDESNYLAPFVKLRWKHFELMYRGLLGNYELNSGKKGFGWNSNQLMLGLYFATDKRDR